MVSELDELRENIIENLNNLELHIIKSVLFTSDRTKWTNQYHSLRKQIKEEVITL